MVSGRGAGDVEQWRGERTLECVGACVPIQSTQPGAELFFPIRGELFIG